MRAQKFRLNGCTAAGILNIMKGARLFTIVSLTAVLLACGQKGPLVLPDKQKPKRAIPSTAKPAARPAPSPAPADPAPADPAPADPAPSTTPTP
jgi:predicted small lipoprotein YifL